MTEDFKKYSDLIRLENPYEIFNEPDNPYFDYIFGMEATNVWQRFSHMPILAKQENRDLSKNDQIASHYMLAYACLLEQFIKDDLAISFCELFPIYCKLFMQGDRSAFFYDNDGNTIFHYDAINGKERGKIYANMFKFIIKNMKMEEKTLKTYKMTVASIQNNDGVSIYDVYNAN